ncbi:hypothetical protein PMI10_00676 [Flavobacterium sp. CF136]|nr:hypothetical protein PMI10_00676 [Flavobacterium sp. CF136]
MEIPDIIISLIILALVFTILWNKFKGNPSNKYHNDSWKKRKSGR